MKIVKIIGAISIFAIFWVIGDYVDELCVSRWDYSIVSIGAVIYYKLLEIIIED